MEQGQLLPQDHDKYFSSLTEQEIHHGLSEMDRDKSFAFLRNVTGGTSATAPALIEENPRLNMLKAYVTETLLPDNIYTAEAAFRRDAENPSLDEHLRTGFAEKVENFLKDSIDTYIKRVKETERAPDHEFINERAQHQSFCNERLKIFFGRENTLRAIENYLDATGAHPLILYGHSGIGKSALIAKAIKTAQKRHAIPVIYRFVGASTASSDIRSLLISLIEDLATEDLLERPDNFETNVNKFNSQISDLLSSIDQPVAVFIDALDQLQQSDSLYWLPATLPGALKLVLSVLRDEDYEKDSCYYHILVRKYADEDFLNVEGLGAEHADDMLAALQGENQRTLQPEQKSYLLVKFKSAGSSPLYLKIAFEIAKSWHDWDEAGDTPGCKALAVDVPTLIAQFFSELVTEHHHASKLVTRSLGYLAAARHGLSEKELTDILSCDDEVMKAISNEYHKNISDKLPPSIWTRLESQLAAFLVEKQIDHQPLLHFFHRQINEAVGKHYLASEKQLLHQKLGDYFESLNRQDGERTRYNLRALSELPFQLHNANNIERLKEILLDPAFIEDKLAGQGTQLLIDDYRSYGDETSQAASLVGRALSMSAGTLSRDCRQLIPHLLGRLQADASPDLVPLLARARHMLQTTSLVPRHPSLTLAESAQRGVFQRHTDWIYALSVLPDGRLASASRDKSIRLWDLKTGTSNSPGKHEAEVFALAVLPDGRLASGSADSTIKLWNVATGECEVLNGHGGEVKALAVLPDGRLASGSETGVVRIWDLATKNDSLLEGHKSFINALVIFPDGRLVSASHDKTIRIWNPTTGKYRELKGHEKGVNSLIVLPDGRLASGSADRTIRLWDISSNTFAVLKGHQGGIWALAVLPATEDRSWRVVSGASDNTIRLWDITKGTSDVLDGHGASVRALVPLPDGQIASASWDKSIRLWDTNSNESEQLTGIGRAINAFTLMPDGRLACASADATIRLCDVATGRRDKLEGHEYEVLTLVVLPDGRLASGSQDNTIRLWDLATGRSDVLDGNGGGVNSLVLLPDGKLASASDDECIRFWDLASGINRELRGHNGSVRAMTLLPDGQLASGSDDGTVRIWDVTTGKSVALEGHTDKVYALAVLPDGRLVSGSVDTTLRIWDVATGTSNVLSGHKGEVWALGVLAAKDDKRWRLASASRDDSVRLWDVARGGCIACFDNDAGFAMTALHTLPDGKTILAGDRRGRIHWLEAVEEIDKQAWLKSFESDNPSIVSSAFHRFLRKLLPGKKRED